MTAPQVDEQPTRFRKLSGWQAAYTNTILTLIPLSGIAFLLHLPRHLGLTLYMQQYFGLAFGLIIASALLLIPIKKGDERHGLPRYDLVFSILALVAGLYISVNYEVLTVEAGLITPTRVFLGCVSVLLTLEASRRVVGRPFVIIILLSLFYALFASHLPGALAMKSVPWDSLASYLYLDPQGILGVPLKIAATIVLVFIIFGQVLTSIGGGKVFMDLSFSLMGKYRGGPAKVAVIGSSLFGTITGSAVANVATIGVFTIPLMKKAGYRPHFAGAVEAVSGTGGQIMPPIMGAAAFLMATFLGIPYARVALAALLPAILYYVAVFIQIDLQAARTGLVGLPREELPTARQVLGQGWPFLSPFVVLVIALFLLRLEPEDAGLITTALAVMLGFGLRKKTGLSFRKLAATLPHMGRGFLEVGVTSAGAGIIIGVLSITGLGFVFSTLLVGMAQGHVFLLLIMAAMGAVILGMGMTVTAAYLLMIVLIAPALVDMGVSGLLAHFFVFYFAVLSFLTPPVCLAVYAAASLAEANMMKTAAQAMRLGIAAYIVPFLFAYRPALLLQGDPFTVIVDVAASLIGISLVAVALEGYLFSELSWKDRICLIVGGLCTMISGRLFFFIGLAVALPPLFATWRRRSG